MKPIKLYLENFGPFTGKVFIDFTALEDIFLITGKTGAGKTTIFDAICFALYGKVPGGRNEHLQRLKSDFGSKYDGECSIKLEFTVGEKYFRIERSPKQEKSKKRGTGVTIVEESAILSERKKGEWESASAKKSEADEKIKKIIGLDPEEFFKIVLLPQGEFAEFLRQDGSKRKNVLGKLFPVDDATKIREIAVERAKDMVIQAREVRHSIEDVSKRLSLDNIDDIRARYVERLSLLKTKIRQLSEDYITLNNKLEQKQEEKRLEERLLSIKRELLSLDNEKSIIEEKEKILMLSRKAQPLQQFIALEEAARQIFNRCSEEWETAHENAVLARQKTDELELRFAEIATFEEEIHALQEKLPLLRAMSEEEKVISTKKDEIIAEKEQISHLTAQKGILEQEIAEKDREIQMLQSFSSQTESLDALYDDARVRKDNLVYLKDIAQDMETLLQDEKITLDAVENIEKHLDDLEKDIPVLINELKHLEAEKTSVENVDRAVRLAATLKKGEACPVCGSREHPYLAVPMERVFGLDERIETHSRSLKIAERDSAVQKTALENKKRELDRVQKQIIVHFEKASDLGFFRYEGLEGAEFEKFKKIDKNEIDALLRKQITELNAITDRRRSARQSNEKLPLLYKGMNVLQTQIVDIEKRLASSKEKQRSLNKEISVLEQKLGTVNVAQALKDTEAHLNCTKRSVLAFHDEWGQAKDRLSDSKAREDSAFYAKESAEKRLEESVISLEKAIMDSPFASASAVKAAILDEVKEAGFEREIDRWKWDRTQFLSLKNELEERLMDSRTDETVSEAEITAKLKKIVAEQELLEKERNSMQVDMACIERDEVFLQEKQAQWIALNKESETLNRLKDDLEGKNLKRRSFEAWLLGKYLAEVATFASKRLEKMSEGRYSLFIDRERTTGRTLSGLDLVVFDAYTGKTRPCATLSGGESFMASISLALGLADSIQSRSGGVRLDAVFIDEGFGSLDETSLDKAMGILDELRDSRMVGLISHVESLRSRVPSRIEVVKGVEGSRIMNSVHKPR
ncbi:MAG: AAA family ATPase [Treponema sp.]|jgi:exonuclease SbcC|nr:AAA family ATPase [Treponema sp.]